MTDSIENFLHMGVKDFEFIPHELGLSFQVILFANSKVLEHFGEPHPKSGSSYYLGS